MNKTFLKIFELYVFVYAFFFASKTLSDGDFWWHLKTGEYILQKGAIPRTDFYSFTNYGKAWVAHEWLSEAIFYAIYSRLGFNALILVFAILTALAFWIILKRTSAHPFIGGFAVLLGVWSILPTIGVRPRVFTLLLASIYLALLSRYARTGTGRAIWWLVPLMAVWVNLHGGFLIGLVLIMVTIAGILLDAWLEGQSLQSLWPRIRVLSLVFLACFLVAFLNPQGWRIYLFPFEIFFSPVQQQEIQDWSSPDFHQPQAFPLALLILLTIAAMALSPRRVKPSQLILFLATLYATLKSNRHMAIFALVAAPMLADYAQNWLASTRFGKIFSEKPGTDSSGLAVLLSVLLLIPLIGLAVRLKTKIYSPPSQTLVKVPLNAVEYLRSNQITGNTFTESNIWGGYVIWALPSNPVYIDGRIDMYGDEFVRDYVDLIRGRVDWKEPFDRYGVRVAIIRLGSPLILSIRQSSDWQEVYNDEMAVVFVRK